jgi:hypothetical protein
MSSQTLPPPNPPSFNLPSRLQFLGDPLSAQNVIDLLSRYKDSLERKRRVAYATKWNKFIVYENIQRARKPATIDWNKKTKDIATAYWNNGLGQDGQKQYDELSKSLDFIRGLYFDGSEPSEGEATVRDSERRVSKTGLVAPLLQQSATEPSPSHSSTDHANMETPRATPLQQDDRSVATPIQSPDNTAFGGEAMTN